MGHGDTGTANVLHQFLTLRATALSLEKVATRPTQEGVPLANWIVVLFDGWNEAVVRQPLIGGELGSAGRMCSLSEPRAESVL